MTLKEKIVLVTGASQGIGAAIAGRLAAEGAIVVAAARNTEKLAEIVAGIEAAGGRAEALAMDVSETGSVVAGVKSIVDKFGRIDILVNNAGITEDNLILRMSREAWDRVLATNLTAAFLLCQAAVKIMIRNRSGRIINITSVVGLMGNAGQVNYASAKAGLIGLTKSLAREVASRQITVNAVAPGFVATPMTDKMTEAAKSDLSSQIPLGHLGSANDIAGAVAFLASDDASYITGHVLNVSGGLYI